MKPCHELGSSAPQKRTSVIVPHGRRVQLDGSAHNSVPSGRVPLLALGSICGANGLKRRDASGPLVTPVWITHCRSVIPHQARPEPQECKFRILPTEEFACASA